MNLPRFDPKHLESGHLPKCCVLAIDNLQAMVQEGSEVTCLSCGDVLWVRGARWERKR